MQDVETIAATGGRDPFGVRGARCGHRPHGTHLRREAEGEVERLDRINLKDDISARAVRHSLGREHRLPHRERQVRVGDDGSVRMNLNLGGVGLQIDGHRVAFDLGANGHVADQFDGQNPRFERALLLAEHNALRPRDGEGKTGNRVTPQHQLRKALSIGLSLGRRQRGSVPG